MKAITRRISPFCAMAGLALISGAAHAQTTAPGGPTCPTVPSSLLTFSTEQTVSLSNVSTATLTPNAPGNTLAAIASGAQIVRERLIYAPPATTSTTTTPGTLTATFFTVASGAPAITPISMDITQQTLLSFVLAVDRIYQSCTPTPSIMFVGTIRASGGGPGIPFGVFGTSFVNAPAAVAIGYTNVNPPVINNAVTLIAGNLVAYSASANGTVTFPAAPVTPPNTTGGITIVVNTNQQTSAIASGSVVQVSVPTAITLDASMSVNPAGGAVTYQWTSSSAGVVFLPTANSAMVSVQLPSTTIRGDYPISLTITNASGGSATFTFTLEYVGSSGGH